MPELQERESILRIHLKRRGLDIAQILPDQASLDEVLESMGGFVGAEIENVVVMARLDAWDRAPGAIPNKDDLLGAAIATVPLSKLDANTISEMRTFCKDRARPVCPSPGDETTLHKGAGQRGLQKRRARVSDE